MRRRLRMAGGLLTATAVAVGAAGTAAGAGGPAGASPAAAAGAPTDEYGTYRSILPPGQSGTITATDLALVLAGDPVGRVAVDGQNAPENFADQLETYDELNTLDPASITADDVAASYKDSGFTPDEVVEQASPRDGVDIAWDTHGVPYVTGETYLDTMYGAGWAGAHDRMFLMDVLRHAGRGELAGFAGATPANLAMDREQLASAFYTEREARAQITRAADRFGAEGARLARAAEAYVEGINAAQDQMCPGGLPVGPQCPAEYAALQKTPEPWTLADVVYVASLVGGIFGKGGGGEADNARWLQQLEQRLGRAAGRRVYDDLRAKDDADAPTTASVPTPYGGPDRVRPDQPGVALPDLRGRTAPGSGDPINGTPDPGAAAEPGLDSPLGSIDVPIADATPDDMSNALLVAGDRTESGHPLAVMGPQTGYFTPQLLTEQVLVGPGVKARGVAFAGTNLVVQLGRGEDYAWSATSASGDLVDTVVERLCNRDGSRPTVRSTAYLVDGRCVPMDRFTPGYTAVPSAAAPDSPPRRYTYLVLRTRHGLVQERTTVDGRPVAVVSQRSTYGRETDSVVGFSRFNDPGFVTDAASFTKAAAAIDYTFNWFYADSRDIGYYSSGRLPVRAGGVDYDLPRWGERRYDWQGWLPDRAHVQQVDPPQGYLVSWNNKPAPGFAAADDVWGYGSVYRSQAIEERVRRALAGGGRLDLPEAVGLMADAGTVDLRARATLPRLLAVIGKDRRTAGARRVLRAWLADGAHRVDRDRDGSYAHEQAVALFDTWWEDGAGRRAESVARDVLADRLGDRLTRRLPKPLDNHPRLGQGSAWNNVAWYGYVEEDLGAMLGRRSAEPFATSFCGRGDLRACRATLRTSLRGAVDRALAAQDVDEVGELSYDKAQDDIRSSTAGVVGTRPIDWQNRPTYQAVVEFTDHR